MNLKKERCAFNSNDYRTNEKTSFDSFLPSWGFLDAINTQPSKLIFVCAHQKLNNTSLGPALLVKWIASFKWRAMWCCVMGFSAPCHLHPLFRILDRPTATSTGIFKAFSANQGKAMWGGAKLLEGHSREGRPLWDMWMWHSTTTELQHRTTTSLLALLYSDEKCETVRGKRKPSGKGRIWV